MADLKYRSFVDVDDLAVDECTIHRAGDGTARWWHLWARILRIDGVEDAFVVAVAPRGAYQDIPGRRTWGLVEIEGGRWCVTPSIKIMASEKVAPGLGLESPKESEEEGVLWHKDVVIAGVPSGESWASGGIP